MDNKLKEQLIKVCEEVSKSAQDDAKTFDGKPFDVKTVGTYFSYQGAAICALSTVLQRLIEETKIQNNG